VRAAGYDSNFLLNVGPMPNGKIQPEKDIKISPYISGEVVELVIAEIHIYALPE